MEEEGRSGVKVGRELCRKKEGGRREKLNCGGEREEGKQERGSEAEEGRREILELKGRRKYRGG